MAETGTAIDQIANIPEIAFTLHAFPSCVAPVDHTLTLAEQAADAKTTGDAVNELQENVADTEMTLLDDYLHMSPQEIPAAKKRNVQSELGLVDLIYPVGAFYISFSSVSPRTLFSGTQWEQIRDCFLFAADNEHPTGNTGGSSVYTHTMSKQLGTTRLTAAQTGIQAHTHGSGVTIPAHDHPFTDPMATLRVKARRVATNQGAYRTVLSMEEGGVPERGYVSAQVTGEVGTPTQTPDINGNISNAVATESSATHSHTLSGIGSIVTMPPYIAVNVWKRVA